MSNFNSKWHLVNSRPLQIATLPFAAAIESAIDATVDESGCAADVGMWLVSLSK